MISSILLLICFISISQCNGLMQSDLLQSTSIARMAQPGEAPYQISLQTTYSNFHFCGGTLITNVCIVTAAHCVDGRKAEEIKAVAGIVNLIPIDNPNRYTREITQIIIHKEYDPRNSWRNNIALLKVYAFPQTKYIRPVDILTQDRFLLPYPSLFPVTLFSQATVSGYGNLMKTRSPIFSHLYISKPFLIDQSYCRKIYEPIMHIFDTQICAHCSLYSNTIRVVDSGGPLIVDGQLAGVISRMPDNLHTDFPIVFTYVPLYSSWINTALGLK